MRSPYELRVADTTEIQRQILRGNASVCKSAFGVAWTAICREIFRTKPAEELAARVGCSVRSAAYEISGEHHPSAQSVQELINAVVPKWK